MTGIWYVVGFLFAGDLVRVPDDRRRVARLPPQPRRRSTRACPTSRASTPTATPTAGSACRSTSTPCCSSPSTSRSSSSSSGRSSSATCRRPGRAVREHAACSSASSCSGSPTPGGRGSSNGVEATRRRRPGGGRDDRSGGRARRARPLVVEPDGRHRADRRLQHALAVGRPERLPGRPRAGRHPPPRVRGVRARPARRRPLVRPARGDPDQGRLRPRPDPGEQPLAAPVGPGLLRDGDDVRGDVAQRHGSLGHVPVPRLARARPTC